MVKYLELNGIPLKIFSPSKKVEQVLIGIHGFSSSKEGSTLTFIGEGLEDTNVLFITFDLPNHGKSNTDEPLSLKKCLQALKLIEEYAYFFSDKVSIFASSFGAYLTLLHLNETREIDFSHVILRAPAVYIDEIFKNEILPANGESLETLENSEYLILSNHNKIKVDYNFYHELIHAHPDNYSECKSFINVIQGDEDELIDLKKNEAYFRNNFNSHYKIQYFEGAKHSFTREEDKEKLLGLIKEILFK